jgi:hypothetical protein
VVADVLKDHSAFILRVKQSILEDIMILHKAAELSHNDMTSHARMLRFAATLL